MYETPSHYFLCAGHSEGYSPLNAFDQALIAAGVGDTNLVRLSSILPPDCRQVEPFELPPGSLVPVAYSSIESSTVGELICAAVAIAIPEDSSLPGLIMEYHDATSAGEVRAQVREMAIRGMQRRERPIDRVVVKSAEHVVQRHGAAFAGVVLWNGDGR